MNAWCVTMPLNFWHIFFVNEMFQAPVWKDFFFFFFFFFFFLLLIVEMFLCHVIFFFLFFLNSKMKYTFSDFILHTFKKFKFKFYHSTEGHTFSFWPCYIRYVLLIIDKLPVEFSLLMPLLHLPLETINRFIHPRHFFTILLSLYFFIMKIR